MLRAEGASASLRREIAGQAVAVHARRQAARGHVQLAGLQITNLSQAEGWTAEEIPGDDVALINCRLPNANCQLPIELVAAEVTRLTLSIKIRPRFAPIAVGDYERFVA